jgi:hypothetical protein
VTVNTSASPATINGGLSLPAGRTIFSVASGTAVDDLVVNATISGARPDRQAGAGRMLLTAPARRRRAALVTFGVLAPATLTWRDDR